MIFRARDALRQTALRWGPHASVASRTHWISLGDLRHRRRNDRGCAGVSFMRAFRPPCQRTGAPVRDSQWPGRRNLPRRGTPRRAPVCVAVLGAFTDPWPLFSTFAASKMTALSPRAWFFSATALGFHGDRNRRMRCPLLVCSALAIGAVVSFGSDAHAREQPVYCDPPTVTVVARGAIVGGKLCNGPWGCRCAHWFCQQCSTLPTRPVSCPPSLPACVTSPLSCEWTTCAPLGRPPARARR